MPQSKRFRILKKRLAEIRKNFLPREFSATASYTAKQIDLARGYRLLSHAEIEAFIEDIASTVIRSKVQRWEANRKPSNLLVAFLACYHAGWSESSDDPGAMPEASRKKVKNDAAEVVRLAFTQYMQKVRENHGVKDSNIKRLILPTGVALTDLDQAWLANLNSFGELRGIVAHTSVSTQQTLDPQNELQTVNSLIVGLSQLDELIAKAGR
jgi:hypothetical protein